MTTAFACPDLASRSPSATTHAVGITFGSCLPGSRSPVDAVAVSVGDSIQLGRPLVPSSRQMEWEHEDSFRRIYAALSNVLDDPELHALLQGFLALVAQESAAEEAMDTGEFYVALHIGVTRTLNGSRIWAAYVKARFPKAPEGFSDVGQPANGPKNKPSDSIRLEQQQRMPPGAHESASDIGSSED